MPVAPYLVPEVLYDENKSQGTIELPHFDIRTPPEHQFSLSFKLPRIGSSYDSFLDPRGILLATYHDKPDIDSLL